MNKLLPSSLFNWWVAIAFVLGLGIGLPFNLKSLSLKFEIDIVGIIEILITVFLALYITNTLEKRVQDNRIEKELFIAKVKRLEDFIIELRNSLSQNNISYTQVNGTISRCRIKKQSTLKSIKAQFELSKDNTYKTVSQQITNSLKRVKNLMTRTDVGNQTDVSMKNDILTYSSKRLSLIHKELDSLEDLLFKLTLFINSL